MKQSRIMSLLFAVLSVGGFLGIGEKYVAVSYGTPEIHDNKTMLRGATSDSLKNLPKFEYATKAD